MKVLLVTEAAGGGVGRHVIDLARGLAVLGDEITVVHSPTRLDATFKAGRDALPNVTFLEVPMRRPPHPHDLIAGRTLRRIVRTHGPFDVVHAQSTKAGLLARGRRPLAPRVLYTPHCVYSMNPDAGLAGPIMRRWEVRLARRTDAIVAVSPLEQQHLLDAGVTPDKLHFIPNGIDPTGYDQRDAKRSSLGFEGKEVVGFLGRLDAQKDPELLIRAFATLSRARPKVILAIAGTGPLEASCRALATDLGLNERVVWLGHSDARTVLPAFDLFAMTSRYESFPYVLLEALAAGLPLVTTDVGGSAETLTPGMNGIRVHSRQPDELAQAFAFVLEDATRRDGYAAASRKRAADFHVDTMVERTRALYSSSPQDAPRRAAAARISAC